MNLSDWPLYWGAQQSSADDDLDEEHNKDGTYHCIFPSVGVEGAAGVSRSTNSTQKNGYINCGSLPTGMGFPLANSPKHTPLLGTQFLNLLRFVSPPYVQEYYVAPYQGSRECAEARVLKDWSDDFFGENHQWQGYCMSGGMG